MSDYYNPNRTRNLYDSASHELFRLSRGKRDGPEARGGAAAGVSVFA